MISQQNRSQYETLIPFGISDDEVRAVGDDPTLEPGRVVAVSRGALLAHTRFGETWCTLSGNAWAAVEETGRTPCAGDWIVVKPYADGSGASCEGVLPRRSLLERHAAGRESKSQPLAANIDAVLIVMGLDANFNPSRMERFVAVAWASGAQPVAILNKADVVDAPDDYVRRIEGVSPGVPVHAVSAVDGTGLEQLSTYVGTGATAVLLGSSGVGKSTILNRLAGAELRATREVRSTDGRGRHTTSLRELFVVPAGGCLIDSPGVREVGLWGDESMLDDTFADVAELAAQCKFSDCAHESEPGCAVKAALQSGALAYERYESYLELKRELEFVAARTDQRLRHERRKRNKEIAQYGRAVQKRKRNGRR